ncbi:MAG: MFS transporter [Candidatus Latescibacterota bacterium]|nr:MAG: MFS transporter [Candidatus Latescibacterota bacterium]
MTRNNQRKSVFSWVLYDWANSAFSTTVVAGFFPVFFKQYLSAGADVTVSTLRLGTANSLGSIIVAVLSPVLGAIADKGGAKKKLLFMFAMLGIVMTGALHFVEKGQWEIAVLIYVTATIGFASANNFYDSLLVSVASDERSDFVSALGFATGYLGGGVLFALNVVMTLKPELFGLRDSAHAVRVSFVTVAVWWAIFSIPIYLFVKEPPGETRGTGATVRAGLRQLRHTFDEVRRLRVVFLFLLGYWCYIDGVHTITRMAVDYGLSLGFEANSLVVALIITQFVGFPAAIVFGKIGERRGAKTGITIGIIVYIGVCVWAYFMKNVTEFYVLATTVGLVLGGIQSLSRSLYSRIIPKNKAAEFFGFYNMLGKFAAVIGPVLLGWVGVLTGNPRFAILSVIVLFAVGGLLLFRVNESAGREAARELERV